MSFRTFIPSPLSQVDKTTLSVATAPSLRRVNIRALYVALGDAIGDSNIKTETRFRMGTTDALGFQMAQGDETVDVVASSPIVRGGSDQVFELENSNHYISLLAANDSIVVNIFLCK